MPSGNLLRGNEIKEPGCRKVMLRPLSHKYCRSITAEYGGDNDDDDDNDEYHQHISQINQRLPT